MICEIYHFAKKQARHAELEITCCTWQCDTICNLKVAIAWSFQLLTSIIFGNYLHKWTSCFFVQLSSIFDWFRSHPCRNAWSRLSISLWKCQSVLESNKQSSLTPHCAHWICKKTQESLIHTPRKSTESRSGAITMVIDYKYIIEYTFRAQSDFQVVAYMGCQPFFQPWKTAVTRSVSSHLIMIIILHNWLWLHNVILRSFITDDICWYRT